jgi:hypothetical protein
MTPTELLKTVYLGDRACKAILLEGWDKRVVVHVDVISRIRSETGSWDFYTAEDIPDGRLVFAEVRQVRFEPSGPVPNDLINELVVSTIVESSVGKPVYTFSLSVGSVDDAGRSTEVLVEIKARDVYLQDPRTPAREIRE